MIDGLIAQSGAEAGEVPQAFRFRYSHPAAYGSWPENVLLVTDRHRYMLDKSRHALKPFCEAYLGH